jgi:hypothetical protein
VPAQTTATKNFEIAVGDSLLAITDLTEALHRYSDVAALLPEDLTRARAWANSLTSLRDIVVLQVKDTERRAIS